MEETEAVFFGLSWPCWLRRGAAFAGAILILAGGIGIWSGVRRQQKTRETVIADYEVAHGRNRAGSSHTEQSL